MHKSNNYISFIRAKVLIEQQGYSFRQDLNQSWFKVTNGKENFFLNHNTAKKIKDEVIQKPANIRLANAFIDELNKVLSPSQITQINTLNRFYEDSCATHEFCDPNECMAMAFIKAFGTDIMMNNQQHVKIANEAWSLAKKHKFFKIK
jgi:hypothetical protein